MKISLIIPAIILSVLFAVTSPAQVSISTVALSGDDAPDELGVDSGDDFDWFNDIVINPSGSIALRAGLAWSVDVDKNNDSGIWTDTDGSLALLARESDPAPGTGALFKELIGSGANPAIADNGDVVFRSRLFVGEVFVLGVSVGTSVATNYTDFGLWTYSSDDTDTFLVVRQGDYAPDSLGSLTGSTFTLSRTVPVINDTTGSVAIYSTLFINQAGSDASRYDNVGVWFWDKFDASLTQVARTDALYDLDDEAPLGPITEKCFSKFLAAPVLGASLSDPLAFAALLRKEPKYDEFEDPTEDRVTSRNTYGIWAGDPDAVDISVRGGDDTTITSTPFKAVYAPDINASGATTFRSKLVTLGTSQNEAIWKKSPALQLIARKGSTSAPGVAGGTFRRFRYDPVISDNGVVAFLAELNFSGIVSKDNDLGIWKGATDSTLSAIATEGGNATDGNGDPLILPSDLVNTAKFNKFYAPSINQNGQVAFRATLKRSPTGLTSAENEGIWAQLTDDSDLILVVRRGDTLAGKTVAALRMVSGSGGSDGRPRGWVYDSVAGKGMLAFVAKFTDGDWGAFIAEVN
jgi:hypothetical protein